MTFAKSFEPVEQHQRNFEEASNAADNILDGRQAGTTQHDFTSGSVEITDDQMRAAAMHEAINVTAAGRILTIPAGSGETQGPLFLRSDEANTENLTIKKGTTEFAIEPGTVRYFWNEDTTSGLIEGNSGGASLLPASTMPRNFNGARVTNSGTQDPDTNSWFALSFDTEDFDVGGWHVAGTDSSRLTVPAGVERVQLAFQLATAGTVSSGLNVSMHIGISKNGGEVFGVGNYSFKRTANQQRGAAVITEPLDVVEGDYFEAHVLSWWVDEIIAAGDLTAFAIWEVAEPSYGAAPSPDIVSDFFAGTPGANATIYAEVLAEELAIADDFAGSDGHVETNPSSATQFDVFIDNATEAIGSVSFSTGGVATFSTTASGTEIVPAGSLFEVRAPGTLNGIAGIQITFKASST